jgi:ferredoxin
MPSVSAVRPARCRGCGAASQPLGRNVVVHGDGTRERQVWGPCTPGGAPALTAIRARRYECQRCGACMVVVPSDVLPGRLYNGPAIALALALWAVLGKTAAMVRARISPFPIIGATAAVGWITLRRWALDAGRRRLFATSRAAPADFTARKHAERAASAVLALAPPGLDFEHAVFAGGALHRPP